MATTAKTSTKFSLTAKLAALFGLGLEGKADSFYSKVVKVLTKEIKALKKNNELMEFHSEERIDALTEKLEDATQSASEQLLNVAEDNLKNNEAMNSYVEKFLVGLSDSESEVGRLIKAIETEKTELGLAIDSNNEEIAKREAWIAKIK